MQIEPGNKLMEIGALRRRASGIESASIHVFGPGRLEAHAHGLNGTSVTASSPRHSRGGHVGERIAKVPA